MPRLSSLTQKSLTVLGKAVVAIQELAQVYDVDITTRSYTGNRFQIGSGDDREPDQAITLVDSGTRMIGTQQPNILVYDFPVGYRAANTGGGVITSSTINASQANIYENGFIQFGGFKCVHMNKEGTYLYAIEYGPPSNFALWRASMTTPYDITTCTGWTESAGASSVEPFSVRLSPSGAYLYLVVNGEIRMWDLPDYWDVSGIDLDVPDRTRNYNTADNLLDGAPGDIAWSNDGTELFVKTGTYGQVRIYTCTTAWDPTDVTGAGTVEMATGLSDFTFATASGLWLEPTQGKVWCTGQDVTNNVCYVYEYDVDVTNAPQQFYPLSNTSTDPFYTTFRNNQKGYSFVANDGIYTDFPIVDMSFCAFFGSWAGDPDMANWDVSTVTNFYYAFGECPFNQNIGGWNVSNSRSFESMFQNNQDFSANIASWNVSKCKDFSSMFNLATGFAAVGLDSWDVSSSTNMTRMFRSGDVPNAPDLSGWDVSAVTDWELWGNVETALVDNPWTLAEMPKFRLPEGRKDFDTADFDTSGSIVYDTWIPFTPTIGTLSDSDGDISTLNGRVTLVDNAGTSTYILYRQDLTALGAPQVYAYDANYFENSTWNYSVTVTDVGNAAGDGTTPRLRIRCASESFDYLDLPLTTIDTYTGTFTITGTALGGNWELDIYLECIGTNQRLEVSNFQIWRA